MIGLVVEIQTQRVQRQVESEGVCVSEGVSTGERKEVRVSKEGKEGGGKDAKLTFGRDANGTNQDGWWGTERYELCMSSPARPSCPPT